MKRDSFKENIWSYERTADTVAGKTARILRIYFQKGIFAEVTLIFQKGKFVTLPWTYPDYASEEITAILGRIRTRLGADLKNRPVS